MKRTHSAAAFETAGRFAVLQGEVHIQGRIDRAADYMDIECFRKIFFKIPDPEAADRDVTLVAEGEWSQHASGFEW